MTEDFQIDIDWLEGLTGDRVERAAFAQIVISAAKEAATELEDLFAQTVRSGVRASAYDLAMWFAGNWWRLRWEPEARAATDWRLSHIVAAAGGGIAWPNVAFVSDGVHVLVEARKTNGSAITPVRYLRDLDVPIRAQTFVAGIDEFVDRVLARLSSLSVKSELSSLWSQLLHERQDRALGAYRKLEALLGFDADDAPRDLIAALQEKAHQAGEASVDEIAAAARAQALETLSEILHDTKKSRTSLRIPSIEPIVDLCSKEGFDSDLPWQRATRAAKFARNVWGIKEGPVSNSDLSDLLAVPKQFFERSEFRRPGLTAGLRTEHGADEVKITVRAKVETGRRFEIMRLVADSLVASATDSLLPVTKAKTDRQKFQRAFAQEFLMPFDDLYKRLKEAQPSEVEISDDEIDDVADDYEVSSLLVRTVLVNRGYLPREVLDSAQ